MDEITKRIVKKTILALRKLLEKEDIPAILKQHGIFPDGRRVPVEKIALLDDAGRYRRERLDAILEREIQLAENNPKGGVERYCREVAFTFLNRLIALRCMEVRGLMDECIKLRADYAGRSLKHNRFRKENPNTHFDTEDTDGLKAFFYSIFRELQEEIKILFDPDDEYSIIMPSLKALRECIRALNEDISEDAFKAPELIGWVYQYFQTEEKDRVFEEVRTKKKKIKGDDIVPATSLYTERYMVDYLVQNSLGAIWKEMYPDSKLCETWPYFVKEQDLEPREPKPVKSLTFLDPACGSGHFLLIAFDLLVQMYEEEARLVDEGKITRDWIVSKEKIATTIIESNLHGIDIDLRSMQLSWLVLYLRMREQQIYQSVPKKLPEKVNLVSADASLLDTPEFLSWCEEKFREEPYALNIIKGAVKRLHNLPEIGSLSRPEEDLKELIKKERERLLSGWERNNGQLEMFTEFLPPEQRELPFDKVTDEQFWNGVLSRIMKALDEYYQQASEGGDTRAQIMIHEASKGFGFLEVCNKRYDVVATNPPYMGSKNMGKELKEYVQMTYPEGKRDLYAAFIQRNFEWAEKRGIIAMVTQQSWMFLKSFLNMREEILKESCIQTIVHLGEHAFDDPAAAGAFVVLFTLHNKKSYNEHKLLAFRLIGPNNSREKRDLLITGISQPSKDLKYFVLQSEFLDLPEYPICYWLPESYLKLPISTKRSVTELFCSKGIDSCNEKKFVRFWWEVKDLLRFLPYSKAGRHCRWFGLETHLIEWGEQGRKIKNFLLNRHPADKLSLLIQHEYLYGKDCLTYSTVARGSMSARINYKKLFSGSGPGIFWKGRGSLKSVLALLNTRVVSFLLRGLTSGGLSFFRVYVERLPITSEYVQELEQRFDVIGLIDAIISFKKIIIGKDVIERSFSIYLDGLSLFELFNTFENNSLMASCLISSLEGINEKQAFMIYKIPDEDIKTTINETGTPPGWYPLIVGYNEIPKNDTSEIPKQVIKYINNHEYIISSQESISKIKSRLRKLYEVGPRAVLEDFIEEKDIVASNNENEPETLFSNRIPIPTETFLEELSVKMEVHPISIYWLLKELREKENVVCWPECRRHAEDFFTVVLLRMLGFRWPKQVEANEPVPEWADKDGIIPITDYTGEKTLLERIRDRIGAEFGDDKISAIEQEFSDILYNADCKDSEIKGKNPPKKKNSLGEWLEREFFKRHTSQFKKRPIAWHLTSSNGTFQVLIFYRKLSGDILKNLKNRYLAKVQQFYRVLLERARSGETISGNLTPGKLQDIETELEEFATKLDKVINLPYEPLIDDGVRVNIAPLQKVGLLKTPVLAAKDIDIAITDRNRWREDDKEQETVWRI